jgi:hypothetical protein
VKMTPPRATTKPKDPNTMAGTSKAMTTEMRREAIEPLSESTHSQARTVRNDS